MGSKIFSKNRKKGFPPDRLQIALNFKMKNLNFRSLEIKKTDQVKNFTVQKQSYLTMTDYSSFLVRSSLPIFPSIPLILSSQIILADKQRMKATTTTTTGSSDWEISKKKTTKNYLERKSTATCDCYYIRFSFHFAVRTHYILTYTQHIVIV